MALFSFWAVMGKSLRVESRLKNFENRGSGAAFPYLGITVPKYKNRSYFSLDKDLGKSLWAR